MPGAKLAPAASFANWKKQTSIVTTGEAFDRHSLRDGWSAAPCSPRCLGLVSHRRQRKSFAPTWPQRRGDRTTRLDRTRL